MSVPKYIPGIPDDTDPEFVAKLNTDITGLVKGLFAQHWTTDPDVFVADWNRLTLEERRLNLLGVWPRVYDHITEDAIDRVLHFAF
jgi:hypothetical protein